MTQSIKNIQLFVEAIGKLNSDFSKSVLELEFSPNDKKISSKIYSNLRSISSWSKFIDFEHLFKLTSAVQQIISKKVKSELIDSTFIELLLDLGDLFEQIKNDFKANELQDKSEILLIRFSELFNFSESTPIGEIEINSSNEEYDLLREGTEMKDYILSLGDTIEKLEANLVILEKEKKLDSLNEIFRLIHNCKGESNYIGFSKLSEFAHITENLLDKLRKQEIEIDSDAIDLLFNAVDILKSVYQKLRKGDLNALNSNDLILIKEKVKTLIGLDFDLKDIINQKKEEYTPYITLLLQHKYMLVLVEQDWNIDKKTIYKRILKDLISISERNENIDLSTKSVQALDDLETDNFEDFFLKVLILISMIDSIVVLNLSKPTDKQQAENSINEAIDSKTQTTSNSKDEVKTMRVDESKISNFANLVGELFIAKNSYEYLLAELNKDTLLKNGKKFKDNLYLFTKLTNNLQTSVMSLRMIPIKGVFDKFQRVVRDISKKQDKNIDLIASGTSTEVDKKIADALSEPLIHLVRNSCDHGIETPEERIRKGKSEKGTIILNASQEGNNLIIKIIDDGKGVDKERVWEKAKSLKIDLEDYNDDNIVDLIFEPGFSTATVISDVSGRGVGMDVVKTTINKLSGTIHVVTEKNKGTELTIIIPMSIGVSTSLLVRQEKCTYAIPFESILETIKCPEDQLIGIHNSFGLYYRGSVIPVVHLQNLLRNKKVVSQQKNKMFTIGNTLNLIVVRSQKGNYAIIVDQLLQYLELAIKQMPETLAEIQVFSGVSILGDGNLVLVLNPEHLI
jgi:two-component system chemotaxis sensor kinase CheA